jgi:prepilin-type N-terminal cleavage/methylation domain-containing protein
MMRRTAHGFTLIEVLVALAIVMLALVPLYAAIGSALTGARVTSGVQQAVSRAQSRLASLDNPRDALGERSGDDGEGFRWATRVRLIASAPPPSLAVADSAWAKGTGLYEVSVRIAWRDGLRERDVSLEGAVLGPVP